MLNKEAPTFELARIVSDWLKIHSSNWYVRGYSGMTDHTIHNKKDSNLYIKITERGLLGWHIVRMNQYAEEPLPDMCYLKPEDPEFFNKLSAILDKNTLT